MITEYKDVCLLCDRPAEHTHHLIFGTAGRKLADEDGLTAPLCHECHAFIHTNSKGARMSKIIGQMAYEKDHTRQEFMKRYGRSFI